MTTEPEHPHDPLPADAALHPASLVATDRLAGQFPTIGPDPDRPLILLVNDDGIGAPGIAAAARALAPLGTVIVVAPEREQSGMGRSLPRAPDNGRIAEVAPIADGVRSFAAHASPAQCVEHGLLEILAGLTPDLVVSGINLGANAGSDVTISGTVGAALHAAALGVPALATSMEFPRQGRAALTPGSFEPSARITARVVAAMLADGLGPGVSLLNLNVPFTATGDDDVHPTTQSPEIFGRLVTPEQPRDFSQPHRFDWVVDDHDALPSTTDLGALVRGMVSLTAMSMVMNAPSLPPQVPPVR